MIDFSIIFPTRERTEKLGTLLCSLATKTKDLSRIEVLVAVDVDDDQTMAWVYSQEPRPWVKFFVRDRAANFSEQYYTWLYRQSTGRYVMALNDDVVFLTQDWNVLAIAALDAARQPDGCILGACLDGYGATYPCFPVLSRQAVEITATDDDPAYYFHPGFTAWGADVHIWRVWSALRRVVSLPFSVDHVSHHCHGELKPDAVHVRMRELSSFSGVDTAPHEAKRIREKLKCIT